MRVLGLRDTQRALYVWGRVVSFSAGQLARTEREWSATAGESVRVEEIGATLYGFCGELGALRLMRCYRWTLINRGDVARVCWSENLKTWFFSLDVSTPVVPDQNRNVSAPRETNANCSIENGCRGAVHSPKCPEREF
jgi:hypothetical protein